jgi:hypothetical protein
VIGTGFELDALDLSLNLPLGRRQAERRPVQSPEGMVFRSESLWKDARKTIKNML